MTEARKVRFARDFPAEARLPELEDFEIVEETLGPLSENQVLYKMKALSIDPGYQSVGYLKGEDMPGYGIVEILESRHAKFQVGEVTLMWKPAIKANPTTGSWRTHGVTDSSDLWHLPDTWSGSPGQALAVLASSGQTPYFGLKKILEAKAGQTIYVNAAAGACGNMVGQIAKVLGCRVVGSAGNDEKVAGLRDLGFDAAFNYRSLARSTGALTAALREAAPEGIDLFWDNVGGAAFGETLEAMNEHGRVLKCGILAEQMPGEPPALLKTSILVWKQLRIEGFLDHENFASEADQTMAMADLSQWYSEGRLKCSVTEYNGLEQAPQAWRDLFQGKTTGKTVVVV